MTSGSFEIFKTNVDDPVLADLLVQRLLCIYPFCRINFDLEDMDRILRVEGEAFSSEHIIRMITEYGYSCSLL